MLKNKSALDTPSKGTVQNLAQRFEQGQVGNVTTAANSTISGVGSTAHIRQLNLYKAAQQRVNGEQKDILAALDPAERAAQAQLLKEYEMKKANKRD